MRLTNLFMVIILLVFISAAGASTTNWAYYWSEARAGGTVQYVGTASDAADGFDSARDGGPVSTSQLTVGFHVRHTAGASWTGTTGWYNVDYREPLTPGGSKTWDNIYCWVSPSWTFSDVQLSVRDSAGQGLNPPSNWSYTMYLDSVPNGVTYNGPVSWDINPAADTVITLPAYTSTVGTDGFRLHFTVTSMVPEPTSFLALASSLAMLGLTRKRR